MFLYFFEPQPGLVIFFMWVMVISMTLGFLCPADIANETISLLLSSQYILTNSQQIFQCILFHIWTLVTSADALECHSDMMILFAYYYFAISYFR